METTLLNRHHFQGQHENEKVLRIIHRHWFNILLHLLVIFGLAVVLIGAAASLPILFPELMTPVVERYLAFVETTLFIFLWLYGYLVWIDYYFDVWIVTNERIVNIEQKGLFTRQISELRFGRVQDVSSTVNGLIPTMLNFGDVTVQTASEEDHFVFRQVPDPFAIKDAIMKLSRSSMQDDIKNMAETFHATTQKKSI